MDEIDRANEVAQNRLDGLLANQRACLQLAGTAECEDCDEAIPTARRAAYPSATRCVDCQSQNEVRKRQGFFAR